MDGRWEGDDLFLERKERFAKKVRLKLVGIRLIKRVGFILGRMTSIRYVKYFWK